MKNCNACQTYKGPESFDMTPYGYERHICRACYKEFLAQRQRYAETFRKKHKVAA